jgi:hypothetical protein
MKESTKTAVDERDGTAGHEPFTFKAKTSMAVEEMAPPLPPPGPPAASRLPYADKRAC